MMSEIAAAVSAGPGAFAPCFCRGQPQQAVRCAAIGPLGVEEWGAHCADALAGDLRGRLSDARAALIQCGGLFPSPAAPASAPPAIPVAVKGDIANLGAITKGLAASGDDGATLIGRIIAFQLKNARPPAEAARAALEQHDGVFAFVALLPSTNTKLVAGVKNSDLFLGFGNCDSFAFTDQHAARDNNNLIALEPDDVAALTPLSISIVDRGGMWIEKRPSQAGGPAPLMSTGAA